MGALAKDMTLAVRKRNDWVFEITKMAGSPFLSLLFRTRREGAAFVPRKEGFVLLPKHQRWEDIPLLALASPKPLTFVAKSELFTNPVKAWFIASLGGIPLNRTHPMESRWSLRTMMGLLKRGEGLVIFPEGTYYRNRMGPGRPGLVRMIDSRFAVPFIPVGINYRREMLRTRVLIRFGRPLYRESGLSPQAFLDQIMVAIARLSDLHQAGGPG